MFERKLDEHNRKMRRIREAGRKDLMLRLMKEAEQKEKEKYYPKKLTTAKVAMYYIFISCTVIQIFSMMAMWHFADLSALPGLIAAVVGETIAFCAYSAKSTKENTEGGITYEMAVRNTETPEEEEEANG